MGSKYDSIKSAADLVREARINGFSTKLEDICKAQDIFGNASVNELVALANDNGRRDADGNPDPRGNWTSGTDGLSKTFYSILFHIWNWEDATRFYNQHSNFIAIDEKDELVKARRELKEAKQTIKDLEAVEKCTENFYEQEKKKAAELFEELMFAKKDLEEAENEIVKLKAKLYDLMVADVKEEK